MRRRTIGGRASAQRTRLTGSTVAWFSRAVRLDRLDEQNSMKWTLGPQSLRQDLRFGYVSRLQIRWFGKQLQSVFENADLSLSLKLFLAPCATLVLHPLEPIVEAST